MTPIKRRLVFAGHFSFSPVILAQTGPNFYGTYRLLD
jgi:hypothetical protein